MRDEPEVRAPQMQAERGRFHDERFRAVGIELESHLMRRRRRAPHDRAAEAGADRTVNVTAHDALDVRVTPDERVERAAVVGGEADVVQPMPHANGG